MLFWKKLMSELLLTPIVSVVQDQKHHLFIWNNFIAVGHRNVVRQKLQDELV